MYQTGELLGKNSKEGNEAAVLRDCKIVSRVVHGGVCHSPARPVMADTPRWWGPPICQAASDFKQLNLQNNKQLYSIILVLTFELAQWSSGAKIDRYIDVTECFQAPPRDGGCLSTSSRKVMFHIPAKLLPDSQRYHGDQTRSQVDLDGMILERLIYANPSLDHTCLLYILRELITLFLPYIYATTFNTRSCSLPSPVYLINWEEEEANFSPAASATTFQLMRAHHASKKSFFCNTPQSGM